MIFCRRKSSILSFFCTWISYRHSYLNEEISGDRLPRSKSWSYEFKFEIGELNLCASLNYHFKETYQFQNIAKTPHLLAFSINYSQ